MKYSWFTVLWPFGSFGCTPRSGIAGLCSKSLLIFWRTTMLFSIAAAPFYILSTVHKGSSFSTSLSTLVAFSLFLIVSLVMSVRWYLIVGSCYRPCHAPCRILVPWPGIKPGPSAVKALSPSRWTAREFPHCGSDLLSLMISDVEHLSICLLGICISSLEKYLFELFACFWIGVFFFSWLPHMACGILVPWQGTELVPPALGVWSLNHWTIREVPVCFVVVVVDF